MKKKYFILLVAILLFLGGCGEDKPECLCGGSSELSRLDYIKNAKGYINEYPFSTDLLRISLYNEEGLLIHETVNLPNCNDSIYTVGTELKISGYFLDPPTLMVHAPFCYTELKIINANEPK